MKTSAPRIFLWLIFVSAPSILLPAYAVYKGREYLARKAIDIPTEIYLIVLIAAMLAGYWLSSKKLIDELNRRKNENKSE